MPVCIRRLFKLLALVILVSFEAQKLVPMDHVVDQRGIPVLGIMPMESAAVLGDGADTHQLIAAPVVSRLLANASRQLPAKPLRAKELPHQCMDLALVQLQLDRLPTIVVARL